VLQRYRGKILKKFFYIKVNIIVYSKLLIICVSVVIMSWISNLLSYIKSRLT
jgi:hypothetical protein